MRQLLYRGVWVVEVAVEETRIRETRVRQVLLCFSTELLESRQEERINDVRS